MKKTPVGQKLTREILLSRGCRPYFLKSGLFATVLVFQLVLTVAYVGLFVHTFAHSGFFEIAQGVIVLLFDVAGIAMWGRVLYCFTRMSPTYKVAPFMRFMDRKGQEKIVSIQETKIEASWKTLIHFYGYRVEKYYLDDVA